MISNIDLTYLYNVGRFLKGYKNVGRQSNMIIIFSSKSSFADLIIVCLIFHKIPFLALIIQ